MRFPFNFRPQFAAAVERGDKRQTVRKNRADHKVPQPGDWAMLYTGLRTRNTRLLNEGPVARCRRVRIDPRERTLVIDGELQDLEQTTAFAKADGFDTRLAMFRFFEEAHGGMTFDGFCVEWEPKHVGAIA